jgi:hypothetical protein
MQRLENWQTALSDYLTSCAGARFKYGRMDCGLFVAGAIQSMTGFDVVASLRDTYTNRKEAFAAIKEVCGRATMEAVSVHLAARNGIPEVPVLCAQRGDAVLLRKGRASSLGLIAMYGTEVLSPGAAGILRMPLSLATRSWHI